MFRWFRSRSSAPAAPARSTSPVAAALSGVAERLLTLEINTIVKAGMSAQKMPEVPLTLHLIARAYGDFLDRMHRLAPRADGAAWQAAWDREAGRNGADDFRDLIRHQEAVRQALALRGGDDGEMSAILVRIRTNCGQVVSALNALKAACDQSHEDFDGFFGRTFDEVNAAIVDPAKTQPTMPSDFSLLVRKAWDMGTETVVMQTSLQIDGDVVTRMSPMVLGTEGGRPLYDDAGRGFIRGIHHEALGSATGQWQSLFQLVGTLIGGLADRVFPRK